MKVVRLIDSKGLIDSLEHNWGLYDVVVEMEDGTEKCGSMQGDINHYGPQTWDFESFEEEER